MSIATENSNANPNAEDPLSFNRDPTDPLHARTETKTGAGLEMSAIIPQVLPPAPVPLLVPVSVPIAIAAPMAAPTAAPGSPPAVAPPGATAAKKLAVARKDYVPTNPHVAALHAIEFQYLSADQTAARLQTNIHTADPRASRGLSAAEANAAIEKYGLNQLTPPPVTPEWIRYLKQYLDPFSTHETQALVRCSLFRVPTDPTVLCGVVLVILLLASAGLSFIAYGLDTTIVLNLYLAIVLVAITFISCTFSFVEEGKASEVTSMFKQMMAKTARVIRDGKHMQLSTLQIVPGDVVLLKAGEAAPADLRIIYSADLKTDLSSLTGESVPIQAVTDVMNAGTRLEESTNVVFNTSQCVEGEGCGVVIATGDNSLIGRIAMLASDTTQLASPLQVEVQHFVYRLTVLAVVTGIVFFIIGLIRARPFLDAFINCFIIIILAWVPQGLPMTVVSCLALTARRLAERNVYIKELRSVETLGSTTVIASDKTGTLTQNKMSVVHLWYDGNAVTEEQAIRDTIIAGQPSQLQTKPLNTASWIDVCATIVNRSRFEDERSVSDDEAQQMEAAQALSSLDPNISLRSASNAYPLLSVIRNDMTLRSLKKKFGALPDDSKRAVIGGDASDMAIFNYAKKRVPPELTRHRYESVFEVPFSSRTKFALHVVRFRHRSIEGALGLASGQTAGSSGNRRIVLMKGAPEVIFSKSTHYMYRGVSKPIDAQFREQFQSAYETFGGAGERVLGFAMHELDEKAYGPGKDGTYFMPTAQPAKAMTATGDEKGASTEEIEGKNDNGRTKTTPVPQNGYTFLGLVSLVDPPKHGVAEAVAEVRRAGVKVIMVTGDHPLTATSIARQVGIITGLTKTEIHKLHRAQQSAVAASASASASGVHAHAHAHAHVHAQQLVDDLALSADEAQAIVVSGHELEAYTPDDWTRTLSKAEIVFARTTPAQKLAIVERLQAMKHIVAVTGDGVNDSPALKKADIGVAMGSGADVAKSAGDVILMDDNFASIVLGIKEGRTIFDNLKKTIAYTVTHLIPEVVPALANLALGLPNGLSSILLLSIDCGTEMAPAISFAYEKSEADVMLHPPRNANTERMVGRNSTCTQTHANARKRTQTHANARKRSAAVLEKGRRKLFRLAASAVRCVLFARL